MDIKEALETDEAKAAIAAAVEEATKGLKTKNDELLGKLKDEKTRLEEIEADKKKAEEEAALASGDAEKIKDTYESKIAALEDKHRSEKADLTKKLDSVLVDNGLSDALTQANIAPQHMKAVKALIKSEHTPEIGEFEGKTAALIEGKPLSQFIADWSQGDLGKHYVAAPDNGGGGANGTNGSGKATTAKKKAEMSTKEKSAFIREHGKAEYDKLQ